MKTLREIMRPGFIVGVQRDARVADAARTMTTNNVGIDYRSAMRPLDQSNIRHLPVVGGDRLLSMRSIRDLMRGDLEDKGQEIRALHEYLYQVPPGRPG